MKLPRLSEADMQDCRYFIDMMLFDRDVMRKFLFTRRKEQQKALVAYMLKYELAEYFDIHSPETIAALPVETIKKTGLYNAVMATLMKDMPELREANPEYLARCMFPGYLPMSDRDYMKETAQNYFTSYRDRNQILAKKYFDISTYGEDARDRACWCLETVIEEEFGSIKEMYEFFSSKRSSTFLRDHKLHSVLEGCFYEYPIDYLHDTLLNDPKHTQSDELLYQKKRWMLNWTRYDSAKRKKMRAEKSKTKKPEKRLTGENEKKERRKKKL